MEEELGDIAHDVIDAVEDDAVTSYIRDLIIRWSWSRARAGSCMIDVKFKRSSS